MGLILFKCSHVMWSSSWVHKTKIWRGYDNGHKQTHRPGTDLSVTSTSSGGDNEDRYILLRFLAGFVIIGFAPPPYISHIICLCLTLKPSGLQASFMTSQATYAQGVITRKQPDAEKPQLGWTSTDQLVDWAFYLASGSTGYLILVVFGTTRESRRQARRLWVNFRGRVRGGKKDDEYVSFRSDDSMAYERPETSEAVEWRRARKPPKAMMFVSSRRISLVSPEGKVEGFEPELYNDIDLKTPRLPANMK